MKIVSFGNPTVHYNFPEWQSKFETNFANARNAYSPIPFMNGGFDELLGSAGFSEVGNIKSDFPIYTDTRNAMEAKRDELKAMRGWGLQTLIITPNNPADPLRYTYARILSIDISEDLEKNSDLIQRCSIIFQAPDPVWYEADSGVGIWGDFEWGDGSYWGTSNPSFDASGVLTSQNIVYNGNAYAKPKFTLICGVGQSLTNPIIRRKFNGIVVDQVSWIGSLTAGDFLTIDAKEFSITKNGVGDYNNFDYSHPDWFRLTKGTNVIEVILNVGGACKVYSSYVESYY